jgi:hypothetical protein
VKILADAETDQILGAHIIQSNAGELISELGLAMEYQVRMMMIVIVVVIVVIVSWLFLLNVFLCRLRLRMSVVLHTLIPH